MSDWLSYEIADFLLFSADTYSRLFVRAATYFWPLSLVVFVTASVALLADIIGRKNAKVLLQTLVSFTLLLSGWGFHRTFYAEINWAAPYFTLLFTAMAVMIGLSLFQPVPINQKTCSKPRLWMGRFYMAAALLAWPAFAISSGQAISSVPFAGLAPDLTILFLLGFLLARIDQGLFVWTGALLWCLISGLTFYGLQEPDWWIMPLLGALALFARLSSIFSKAFETRSR